MISSGQINCTFFFGTGFPANYFTLIMNDGLHMISEYIMFVVNIPV
jgi:hypothetical protein